MRKIESQVPLRQKNWKKYQYLRNKQNNISYQCQCGKSYISFSALFLHFQRKHKHKISNFKDKSQFQTIINGSGRTYLFFTPKISAKCHNLIHSILLGRISELFILFQQELKYQLLAQNLSVKTAKLMKNFQVFIYETQIIQNSNVDDFPYLISQLPLKFNSFFLAQLCGVTDSQEYLKACDIFVLFSEWLNRRGYTELKIELIQNCEKIEQKIKNDIL